MDHSLPVSPLRGISQARLLEWVGFPFPSPEDLPDSWIEPACTALPGRFFTTELPGKPIVYTYHILFYHLFIHGYIYLLTVMNSAAVNMGIQISHRNPIFSSFGYIPRSKIIEYMVILVLIF